MTKQDEMLQICKQIIANTVFLLIFALSESSLEKRYKPSLAEPACNQIYNHSVGTVHLGRIQRRQIDLCRRLGIVPHAFADHR